MPSKLDLYDKKILYYLDIDSRMPATKISNQIKLPKETVNYRIKKLQKKGYIRSFYALINSSMFGFHHYRILFKFHNTKPSDENKIINFIKNNKRCFNLRQTEGPYDISFLLMQKNPHELKNFLKNFGIYFGEFLQKKSIHLIVNTRKLNQKFTYSDKSINYKLDHSIVKEINIDEIDKKIMNQLSKNARIKLVDLARKIGQDYQVVSYRVKKLEKTGAIKSYNMSLDLEKFNKQFIVIDIVLKNPEKVGSIIEYFDKTNKCLFAYETIGRYDLSVELYVDTDLEMRKIIEDFRTLFLNDFVNYDVSKIFKNLIIDWSPFD